MSRVGKKEITIPKEVTVDYNKSENVFTAKGPLGQLSVELLDFISLEITEDILKVNIEKENIKFQKSMWGTTRALINNAITGVTKPFTKEVELSGVGYKMELSGSNLVLYIGYSHPVKVDVPSEIKLTLKKNNLSGESINKQILGDFFTNIHNMKPADPYKHKGFKFPGRFYKKKVGKKAK